MADSNTWIFLLLLLFENVADLDLLEDDGFRLCGTKH